MEVESVALRLKTHLEAISHVIDETHVWKATSDSIYKTFFPWLATNYDVVIESTTGFARTRTPFNRPDAQISLDDERPHRILVEVERGGTITNGHDLKDIWKTHLSEYAKHLILVVPNTIVDENGKMRGDRAFIQSSARLGSFFGNPRTQLDVWSLHIFGYGPLPR